MTNIQSDPPRSQSYKTTIIERLDRDSAFVQALRDEAASLVSKGDGEVAQLIIEVMASQTTTESA